MAANFDTTYLAVRDSITAAIKAAWTLTDSQVIVGEPEKQVAGLDGAWLDSPEFTVTGETAVSDEFSVTWTIRGAFTRTANGKTDDLRAAKYHALHARLNAIGGYAYLPQVVKFGVAETNKENGIGVGCLFTCRFNALRAPV